MIEKVSFSRRKRGRRRGRKLILKVSKGGAGKNVRLTGLANNWKVSSEGKSIFHDEFINCNYFLSSIYIDFDLLL